MSNSSRLRNYKITGSLFVAALLLRLSALVSDTSVLTVELTHDAGRYDVIARHLLDTGEYIFQGYKALIAPMYPVFLAGVYYLPTPDRLTVILLQIILGALTVALVYRIGIHLFEKRVALAAGLIAAIYPPFVFITVRILTEALFLPLLAASVLFTIRFARIGGKVDFILAGTLTGLACLTRPLIFYFPPLVALGIFLINFRRGEKTRIKGLLLYLAFFYLCLTPWAARNTAVLGEPVFTSTSVGGLLVASVMPRDDKYYGFNIRARDLKPEDREALKLPELEQSKALKQIALNHLKENPGNIPRLFFLKCCYLLSPFDWEVLGNTNGTFNPMFLLIAIFGIIGVVKANTRQCRGIVLGLLIYFIFFSFITYSSPRLRIPLELPLVLYAADGWVRFENFSKKGLQYIFFSLAVILIIAGHVYSNHVKIIFRSLFEWIGIW